MWVGRSAPLGEHCWQTDHGAFLCSHIQAQMGLLALTLLHTELNVITPLLTLGLQVRKESLQTHEGPLSCPLKKCFSNYKHHLGN